MDYTSIPISAMDSEFVHGLIENKVDESTTIDYKSAMALLKMDSEKKDYLKDVCSFANTRGGVIVWGIREEDGIPVEVVGVDAGNVDKTILQMEQLLKSGIEPAVPGVQTKRVEIGDKQCVIQRVVPPFYSSECPSLRIRLIDLVGLAPYSPYRVKGSVVSGKCGL